MDALLIINIINTYPNLATNSPVRSFYTIGQVTADTSGDRGISSLDALLVINHLNQHASSSSTVVAEGERASLPSAAYAAIDDYFATLTDSIETRRRRLTGRPEASISRSFVF